MDNIVLFCCGLVVTLIAAFGIIIYAMTPPPYEKPLKKPEPDIDLGSHPDKRIDSIEATRH